MHDYAYFKYLPATASKKNQDSKSFSFPSQFQLHQCRHHTPDSHHQNIGRD